ncbi:MAG: hypothetical protein AAGU75_16980 [Bacillota bacterium]
MNENKLKKLIWTGLSLYIIAFITMIALILASKPIPDLIAWIFNFGIAVTIIASIALTSLKNRNKPRNPTLK